MPESGLKAIRYQRRLFESFNNHSFNRLAEGGLDDDDNHEGQRLTFISIDTNSSSFEQQISGFQLIASSDAL